MLLLIKFVSSSMVAKINEVVQVFTSITITPNLHSALISQDVPYSSLQRRTYATYSLFLDLEWFHIKYALKLIVQIIT